MKTSARTPSNFTYISRSNYANPQNKSSRCRKQIIASTESTCRLISRFNEWRWRIKGDWREKRIGSRSDQLGLSISTWYVESDWRQARWWLLYLRSTTQKIWQWIVTSASIETYDYRAIKAIKSANTNSVQWIYHQLDMPFYFIWHGLWFRLDILPRQGE